MAFDNFTKCCEVTLKYEGGFSNNRLDHGGATNFGITHATLSAWLNRPVTSTDVHSMKLETAYSIYRSLYWQAIDASKLPSGVDMIAFDIAVNSGIGEAMRLLRLTKGMSPKIQIQKLDTMRRGFWRSLKSFSTFGRGWFNREDAVYKFAISLAA